MASKIVNDETGLHTVEVQGGQGQGQVKPSVLNDSQRARVAALKAAREVYTAKAIFSDSGVPNHEALVDIADYIMTGIHPESQKLARLQDFGTDLVRGLTVKENQDIRLHGRPPAG